MLVEVGWADEDEEDAMGWRDLVVANRDLTELAASGISDW